VVAAGRGRTDGIAHAFRRRVVATPNPERVRWIQRALNQLASAGLTVDGKLGPKTRAAIAAFQRSRGLVADGVVGGKTEAALTGANPSPCRLDARVDEVTVLRSIPLGVGGVPNETAIYLPPGLRRSPKVDVIVYLHGWETNRAGKVICGRARTISEYLEHPSFPLREIVRDSGKQAVLVAPKLGGHSEPGSLVRRGGFAAFMDRVLASLSACGRWPTPPSLGRLILSAHSGGGAGIGAIAAVNGELVANLTEVWMFDALYGGAAAWAKLFAARPNIVGRFAFTAMGNTTKHHVSLQGQLGRGRLDLRSSTTTNHCLVPRAELGKYLSQSSLQNR
jgi:hypothetical protein